MVKSVVKNTFHIVNVLFWVALTIFLATLDEEDLRAFSVIGLIVLGCFFLQFCSCLEMHINCKKKYSLIRDINKLRRNEFAKGNLDMVKEYTEDIYLYGEEILELAKCLLEESSWMPRKKIEIMKRDTLRMMKQEYPPL